MNFIDSTLLTIVLPASLLLFLLIRDLYRHRTLKEKIKNSSGKIWHILRHRHYPFFGKKEILAKIIIFILILGIVLILYARFVEVRWLKVTHPEYDLPDIHAPITVIWLTDLQIGNHKKEPWLKKIIARIEKENPDLVILGGDIVDNEGTTVDETVYLEPLRQISRQFPTYYILGNHEYGIGDGSRDDASRRTGDRSQEVKTKMADLGIPLLKNSLSCLTLKKQKICLFGIDEIWYKEPDFSRLEKWSTDDPLIFLTHNPDGLLYWPKNLPPPDLTLAGHTHGGQVWLPGYGPLGNAGIQLGPDYYRGAKKYQDMNIYISVGAGESGGSLRFSARPELTAVTLY